MGMSDTEIESHSGPPGSVLRRIPLVDKALEVLGWKSEVNFDDGIRKYLRSIGFNPKA